jgi:ABC-type multidrug transport system ATPase subunit
MARAVPLWLLDEPHAALDPEGRDLLDGVIEEVSAAGTTVMMASHDLDRADRIASRIVTLQGGRVID